MSNECRIRMRLYSALMLMILSCVSPLMAQVDRVAIGGTVTDASGAIVQEAKVELISTDTGLRRETVTDGAGAYHLPALPIGSYSLSISKVGFKSAVIPSVELAVGQPRTIDVRLEVGMISDAVQVTSVAAHLLPQDLRRSQIRFQPR